MTLYELSAEYQAVFNALDAAENDDETNTVISQCDEIKDAFTTKAVYLAKICKQLAADADAAKKEKDRLADLQKSKERKCKWLKQYLQSCMEAGGITKIPDVTASLTIRNNPESVQVNDLNAALGSGYLKEQHPDESWLDKTAIKAAIQSGENVPGCELIRKRSLIIK